MRCLTLANALQKRGSECQFICRNNKDNLIEYIRGQGYLVLELPTVDVKLQLADGDPIHASWLGVDWKTDAEQTLDAIKGGYYDWLVVDHYAIGANWEKALYLKSRQILVIDDLADRPHNCNLLLDQTLCRSKHEYKSLVGKNTGLLLGAQYSLLRPEFAEWRRYSLHRAPRHNLRQLLLSMGGVDRDNVIGQTLTTLGTCEFLTDIKITVVMGPLSPWLSQVESQASEMRHLTQVLSGVNNMAELMANSDLAIGAAGGTSWERCCLGLPSILIVLAQNQLTLARTLAGLGAARLIEEKEKIQDDLPRILKSLIEVPSELEAMHSISSALIDGEGALEVVKALES
jgi:UDP-2,4-diacetamido-2,4,6-trideoxy-beta-L-altropyranose hydrolase